MSLRFVADRTVNWPVKVRIPADGGRYREEEFIAAYRILPQSTVDALDPMTLDAGLLDEALIGWDGIEDADKAVVPYSAAAKADLLDDPLIRKALIEAYAEAVRGRRPKS